MHSASVLHRDLKPSNLLLNSNCDLKVCDLGLARGLTDDVKSAELTEYVVTRWYRAPEIMLACQEYTKSIDIWSVGCIFAELLARRPLFPGDDYIDQLRKICQKLGKPKSADLDFVTSEKARRFILSLPETNAVNIGSMFPDVDPNAVDLLQKMLQFHPARRISVEEALAHPFMETLHVESDEPSAACEPVFEFEGEDLGRDRLQQLLYAEMCHFTPSLRAEAKGGGDFDAKGSK